MRKIQREYLKKTGPIIASITGILSIAAIGGIQPPEATYAYFSSTVELNDLSVNTDVVFSSTIQALMKQAQVAGHNIAALASTDVMDKGREGLSNMTIQTTSTIDEEKSEIELLLEQLPALNGMAEQKKVRIEELQEIIKNAKDQQAIIVDVLLQLELYYERIEDEDLRERLLLDDAILIVRGSAEEAEKIINPLQTSLDELNADLEKLLIDIESMAQQIENLEAQQAVNKVGTTVEGASDGGASDGGASDEDRSDEGASDMGGQDGESSDGNAPKEEQDSESVMNSMNSVAKAIPLKII